MSDTYDDSELHGFPEDEDSPFGPQPSHSNHNQIRKTTMSSSPQLLTVGEALELPPGTQDKASWINPGFSGLVELVESFNANSGKTFYNVTVVDPDNNSIAIHALFPTPPKFNEGQIVEFSGKGLRRQEYKGKPQFAVSAGTEIHVLGNAPGRQSNPPPAHQQAPAQRPAGSPAPAGTGAQPLVFGATVGMAINQANELMRHIYSPPQLAELMKSTEYCRTLHEWASDIIRVSRMLENGQLAPSVKQRCEGNPDLEAAPGYDEPSEPAGPTPEQQAKIDREHAEALREREAKAKLKANPPPRQPVGIDEDVPF